MTLNKREEREENLKFQMNLFLGAHLAAIFDFPIAL